MDNLESAGTVESPPPPAPPRQPSATIIAALVKAQSQFGRIEKNRENPAYRSAYATLSACLDAVTPALNANGFFLTQPIRNTPDSVTAATVVHHDSGESAELGEFTVVPTKFDPQGVGSASTYAKRYCLKAVFGLSDAEDDDDGNGACAHVPRNQPEQASRTARSAPAATKPVTAAPKPAVPAQASTTAKTAPKSATPPHDAKKAATLALSVIATRESADLAKMTFPEVVAYGDAMGLLMGAGAESVRHHIEAKTGKDFKTAPAPHVRALVKRWRAVYAQFCVLKGLAKHHCGVGHEPEARALLHDLQTRENWQWCDVAPKTVEARVKEIEASGQWVELAPAAETK